MQGLVEQWRARWPDALDMWSRYTRLSEPVWCTSAADQARLRMHASIARINLDGHQVQINLHQIHQLGLDDYALELLAHEIGHHVYAPANLVDNAREIARMRRGLPGKEQHAAYVSNMYEDLLINDRLHRHKNLRMADVFTWMENQLRARKPDVKVGRLWTLYMRFYEILWSLPRRQLARDLDPADLALEGDAQLGARLVRVYAHDWMAGAGRFAALCFPYFEDPDVELLKVVYDPQLDTPGAGAGGGVPAGLVDIDADEVAGDLHPSRDPALSGLGGEEGADVDGEGSGKGDSRGSPHPVLAVSSGGGQTRQPFEYGQLLRALGLELTDHEAAMEYYRERARPNLIRFPTRRQPETEEPQMEGLEAWDIGSPLEDVDWLESVMVSPQVVPGFTTRQRTWGRMSGIEPQREPLDLDLYVDCSGSMPNPQYQVSYLALAGAIISLSALRVGARVQVTLWSGAGQFEKTDGFVSDEKAILRILTGYISGGTAFPLHVLRDTHSEAAQRKRRRKVHIMVISDDGVDTMLDKDERGTAGGRIAREALDRAGGGGTLVLNLFRDWREYEGVKKVVEIGWDIFTVTDWAAVVDFARAFSRKTYGDD